jgi:HPr kinase/phosphorylase
VLVEVYGVGVLLRGDSGIGKSETAIELIKRGHSLVADDAVEIKRVSNITLLGSAPPVIRHFIELRGIGVVDVHNLFGISAVKEVSKIDLVIELEQWVENKHYDRMGLENYTTEILGLNIPMLTVPVRPGRNLAVVVEVAAMNQQQKGLGYNAAKELNERIMGNLEI